MISIAGAACAPPISRKKMWTPPLSMQTPVGDRGERAGGAPAGIGIPGMTASRLSPATAFSIVPSAGAFIRLGGFTRRPSMDTAVLATGMAAVSIAITSALTITTGAPAPTTSTVRTMPTELTVALAPAAVSIPAFALAGWEAAASVGLAAVAFPVADSTVVAVVDSTVAAVAIVAKNFHSARFLSAASSGPLTDLTATA